MLYQQKVVVVMPAYNAALTLEKTFKEIDFNIVDAVILVDDDSTDHTVQLANQLGVDKVIKHQTNLGYGGNQKSCYDAALSMGADIVIMLHPDYQYTPELIPAMSSIIARNIYPVVLGSRILGKGALKGGMPFYKYVANRALTFTQNVLIGQKLSEYHTGYRAFHKSVLQNINYHKNSNDFIFDNQMLSQIFMAGYEVGEVTCPTRYFEEASSINFKRSAIYGLGVLQTSWQHLLHKNNLLKHNRYSS